MKNEGMLKGTRVTKESRYTEASGVSPEIWVWMGVRVVAFAQILTALDLVTRSKSGHYPQQPPNQTLTAWLVS